MGMTNSDKVDAVVLRYANYQDYHRMLTLFTPHAGIISASAPASRRTKSPLRAGSEIFVFGQFLLNKRNSRYTIKSIDIVDAFYDLRMDIVALSCATYLRDFCECVVLEEQEHYEMFSLFVSCLSLLCHEKLDPRLVRYTFELRSLDALGYGIVLDRCVMCGHRVDIIRHIGIAEGGALCDPCAEGQVNVLDVYPGAANTLRQIQYLPLEELHKLRVSDKTMTQIAEFWPDFLRWHLERGFRSASFMDQSYDF